MSVTILTPARQRLIINGYTDMLYLLKKHSVPMPSAMFQRIKDGWDAAKPEGMDTITSGKNEKKSGLILPFNETTRLPHISQVEQYAAAADLKQARGR